MTKRFKNKVRITTKNYRIVQTAWSAGRIECSDGHDMMGVRRWRSIPHTESTPLLLVRLVEEIGAALAKRAKRKARR